MNRRTEQPAFDLDESPASPQDIATGRVIALVLAAVAVVFALGSGWLYAQEGGTQPTDATDEEALDVSGSEPEEAVQQSGMEGEIEIDFTGTGEEAYDLSPSEGEGGLIEGQAEEAPLTPIESFDLSPSEGEPGVAAGEDQFRLPEIEIPDFAELYDLSPAQTERAIFTSRPRDPYYEELISGAPAPDITLLGPLPEAREEGIEFTDVSADWIWHQKSAGLTELRGHVMVIYDTTIITSDEATLDESKEIYRFFGEGRVFVDDADFTLECDELEIHDADDEKMIYIYGQSTLVVYADEDAVEPGEDSTRRERVEYALKQQDTTITFTNGEYDYENDIFDAHGGVRFEQSDKYGQGDEFHGENETEYMLFTGNCEFWQQDGRWLYEHRIVEDQEDPPSKGDRLTRALLSVPTTVTCDEAEAKGDDGWLELRASGGNVVYFRQDDKHAECETFSLWYTDTEAEEEEPVEEGARDLLAEPVVEEVPEEEKEEEPTIPPGFGALIPASVFPPDWRPWQVSGQLPLTGGTETPVTSVEERSETQNPVDADQQDADLPPGETGEELTPIGSVSELTGEAEEMVTGESPEAIEGRRDEIIMQGNVLFRQENGDWLFDYDVVREEEEDEESVEQYRKWANGSCDYLHVWTRDGNIEATGTVFGEQENQDLACDFLRYLKRLDMLYLQGNLVVHREGKHQLESEEGFVFFSTKVFEALGSVRTTVMVDVEERRGGGQEGEEGGGETGEEEVPVEE